MKNWRPIGRTEGNSWSLFTKEQWSGILFRMTIDALIMLFGANFSAQLNRVMVESAAAGTAQKESQEDPRDRVRSFPLTR